MTKHNSALRVRSWLFGAAAFITGVSLTGCGTLNAMNDEPPVVATAPPMTSLPITTTSTEEPQESQSQVMAEANRPASVTPMNMEAAGGSASDLAYATASTEEHTAPPDMQAP